jgi:hypothetical protein
MTSPTSGTPTRRATTIALLIAAPAVLHALTLCALEGWRAYAPDSSLFAAPRVSSLAEAIERNDVEQLYEFIHGGQDPNELIEVEHPVLTGGRRVRTTPMLWAVAMRSERSVLTLIGFGARLDRDATHSAVCLAEALGDDELVGLIERHGSRTSEKSCPEPGTDGVTLVASNP